MKELEIVKEALELAAILFKDCQIELKEKKKFTPLETVYIIENIEHEINRWKGQAKEALAALNTYLEAPKEEDNADR